jgi:hypothetical protein
MHSSAVTIQGGNMLQARHAIVLVLGMYAIACGATPDDTEQAVASATESLDNALPPDGTACYVDGPLIEPQHRYHRGRIQGQFCCFEGYCYACNPSSECQTGGGEPGALTAASATWSTTSVTAVVSAPRTPVKNVDSVVFHKP